VSTTLIEADSPHAADYSARTPGALASMYRGFSYNDTHANPGHVGEAANHDAELPAAQTARLITRTCV
jgi:hypothetical protein